MLNGSFYFAYLFNLLWCDDPEYSVPPQSWGFQYINWHRIMTFLVILLIFIILGISRYLFESRQRSAGLPSELLGFFIIKNIFNISIVYL